MMSSIATISTKCLITPHRRRSSGLGESHLLCTISFFTADTAAAHDSWEQVL